MNKGVKILLIVIIVVVGLSVLSLAGAGIYIYANNNVLSGVKVGDLDVGGLTKDALKQKLTERYADFSENGQLTVMMSPEPVTITNKEINAVINIDALTEKAYALGRSGDFFSRLGDLATITFNSSKVNAEVSIDDAALQAKLDSLASKNTSLNEFKYLIDSKNQKVTLTSGTSGESIDFVKLKSDIIARLNALTLGTIDVSTTTTTPAPVDPDKIYSKLNSKFKNATATEKDGKIVYTPESYGLEVDKTAFLSAFAEIKDTQGESVSVPAKVQKPSLTLAQVKKNLFKDTLGSWHTTFWSNDQIQRNRGHNIRLACSKINNQIINPGKIFSYNGIVGMRSAATGFKEAYAYNNGEIVTEYGGGVCQTSSTLYNCVLLADMKVIYRKNHTFVVKYVPIGQDATVSAPTVDFKFENTSAFPIKMVAYTVGNELYMSIKGLKDPALVKRVVIRSVVTSVDPWKTVTKLTDTLPAGKKVYINAGLGHTGYVAMTYRTEYLNGKIVSNGLLHRSVYRRYDVTCLIGTKEDTKKPKPTPKPHSTPKPTAKPTPKPTPKPVPTAGPT